MKKIKLVIEAVEKGYWSRIDDVETAFAFGETIEELVQNTREGILSYAQECGHELEPFEFILVADS